MCTDEDQRNSHQAQNNILVAYSGDEKLYPAGAAIMWQSKPWPRDVDSFKASVTALRPVFEKKLVDVPPEMKEKVYPVSFPRASSYNLLRPGVGLDQLPQLSWTPLGQVLGPKRARHSRQFIFTRCFAV